ncbi:hypothetical protein RB195_004089 [Necator americanus]|uniref:Uncharacterized protein n=1 Tax=Necator americanus TaxID=51031 RepID=A0ABR1BI38_NECAM
MVEKRKEIKKEKKETLKVRSTVQSVYMTEDMTAPITATSTTSETQFDTGPIVAGTPEKKKRLEGKISPRKGARSPKLGKKVLGQKGEKKDPKKDATTEAKSTTRTKGAQDTVEVEPTILKRQDKVSQQVSPKKTRQKTKLKSRPMAEHSLIELAAKVKKRKEPKSRPSDKPKSVDEDPFPRPQPGKKGKKKRTKLPKTEEFVPKIDSAWLLPEANMFGSGEKSVELALQPTANTLPYTGLPIVRGNNNNNGVIIMDGQPFWVTNIPPDDTDDELVMNAAVLIDVLENRLKLVPMPDIEIVLDPMEETTALAARDSSCYTKEVIFGNTVRSMVNLNELSVRTLSLKGRKKSVAQVYPDDLKQLVMQEPTVMNTYNRKTYNRSQTTPFTKSPKPPTTPPSCTDGLEVAVPVPKGQTHPIQISSALKK